MSEIAKCAWCQKEPERFPRFHDLEDGCICSSKDCPGAIGIPIDATDWNDLQARILEARRKDFEAGWCAKLMQLGGRGPAYSAGGPYFDAALDEHLKAAK